MGRREGRLGRGGMMFGMVRWVVRVFIVKGGGYWMEVMVLWSCWIGIVREREVLLAWHGEEGGGETV